MSDLIEQAVMVCPQCEGEGSYPDGLDEAACSTDCTRCGGNGWIVDLAALRETHHLVPKDQEPVLFHYVKGGEVLTSNARIVHDEHGWTEQALYALEKRDDREQ
jgi:hypothetical protein